MSISNVRHITVFILASVVLVGVSQTTNAARVTYYEYGDHDRPTRVYVRDGINASDPIISDKTITYDERGRDWVVRQRVTDGGVSDNGRDMVTSYWYSWSGRMVHTVNYGLSTSFDPTNPSTGGTGDVVVTQEYDIVGDLTRVVGPADSEKLYSYDNSGNRTKVELKFGPNTGEYITSTYEYDALNRVTKATDGEGNYQVKHYDGTSRLVEKTSYSANDTALSNTRYAYDSVGRLSRTTDYSDADGVPDSQNDRIEEYVYDVGGEILTRYTYSSAGTLTTEYDYDEIGRQTKITDPTGNWVRLDHDPNNGRITQKVVSDGSTQRTFSFAYDDMGRRTLETALGDGSTGTVSRTTQSLYDGLGRQSSTTDAENRTLTWKYDPADRLIRKVEATGTTNERTTDFVYDRLGRLSGIVAYDGSAPATVPTDVQTVLTNMPTTGAQLTRYFFDAAGNRTKIAYPDNQATDAGEIDVVRYEYDYAKRLLEKIDQRGVATTFAYDDRNLLTSRNAVMNGVTTSDSYAYDGLGRLTNAVRNEVDGGTTEISDTVLAYDDLSRLTQESQSLFGGTARTMVYHYDQADNRTQFDYPTDADISLSYTYDSLGRVDVVSRSLDSGSSWNGLVDYDYDGHRVATRTVTTDNSTPISVAAAYGWDGHGQLNQIANTASIGGGVLWAQYDYGFDNVGNRTHSLETGWIPMPIRGITYDYDALHRLTSVDYTNTASVSVGSENFNYDLLGNRFGTGTGDPFGYTSNWYSSSFGEPRDIAYGGNNAANEYSDIDGVTVQYDEAGNMTRDENGLVYEYDGDNRLIRISRD